VHGVVDRVVRRTWKSGCNRDEQSAVLRVGHANRGINAAAIDDGCPDGQRARPRRQPPLSSVHRQHMRRIRHVHDM
jgi:hypothetical protein